MSITDRISQLLDKAGELTGEIGASIETASNPGIEPDLYLAVAASVRTMQAERAGCESQALGLMADLVKARTI